MCFKEMDFGTALGRNSWLMDITKSYIAAVSIGGRVGVFSFVTLERDTNPVTQTLLYTEGQS